MRNMNFLSVNGYEVTEYDDYHPTHIDMTKGGRNPLTGYNNLRELAKKWKVIITASYISDETYKAIIDAIPNTLHCAVVFRDKDYDKLISMDAYVVIDKHRTPESDAMGCWCDFNMELIEN